MAQIKNVVQGAWVTVVDPSAQQRPKLRVAAYVRVSSSSDDQINSYLAQVDFYTKYITSREDWELVDVYADEGLTGMETKKRDEFNRMIADCREGKIDRILVKSVSRFARNQEDYIYFMRELLRLGVTISFEKENIDTGKMTLEQVADIYGAFAQIETTGHSANMRTSYHMRMERGKARWVLRYRTEGTDNGAIFWLVSISFSEGVCYNLPISSYADGEVQHDGRRSTGGGALDICDIT